MRRALFGPVACLLACAAPRPTVVAPAQPPAPAVTRAEEAFDPALGAETPTSSARLGGDGYTLSGHRYAGFLPPSAHAALRVEIPAQRCVAFAGRASAGVHDLDGALYLPDGTLLAEDEGADAEPLVSYCADEAIPVAYLVLRAYRGAGGYAVTEWLRPVRFGDPVLSPDELREGTLRELTVALVRRGFHPDGPVREVRPEAGAALIVPLSVAPFSCYTVVASVGEGAVALRLLDGSAQEVAHGVAETRVSALQRCVGENADDWAIELRSPLASKSVRLWVYSARERDIGGERALWLGEPGASAEAYAATTEVAGASHLSRELSQGQLAELRLPYRAGCQELHVALSPGLTRASVRLEARSGAVLAERDVGPRGAALSYCSTEPAQLVLTGRLGFGTVSLDVVPGTR